MKGEKYKHLTRNVAIELSKSYDKDILEKFIKELRIVYKKCIIENNINE